MPSYLVIANKAGMVCFGVETTQLCMCDSLLLKYTQLYIWPCESTLYASTAFQTLHHTSHALKYIIIL